MAFSTWLSMHFHLSHVTARQSNQGLAVEMASGRSQQWTRTLGGLGMQRADLFSAVCSFPVGTKEPGSPLPRDVAAGGDAEAGLQLFEKHPILRMVVPHGRARGRWMGSRGLGWHSPD